MIVEDSDVIAICEIFEESDDYDDPHEPVCDTLLRNGSYCPILSYRHIDNALCNGQHSGKHWIWRQLPRCLSSSTFSSAGCLTICAECICTDNAEHLCNKCTALSSTFRPSLKLLRHCASTFHQLFCHCGSTSHKLFQHCVSTFISNGTIRTGCS